VSTTAAKGIVGEIDFDEGGFGLESITDVGYSFLDFVDEATGEDVRKICYLGYESCRIRDSVLPQRNVSTCLESRCLVEEFCKNLGSFHTDCISTQINFLKLLWICILQERGNVRCAAESKAFALQSENLGVHRW